MSLADQLIENMESESAQPESAPPGYYVDDLGFYVEENIRKNKMRQAEYILFRIRILHPAIFSYNGKLYYDFSEIKPKLTDILMLADSPLETISLAQAIWIYNRLRDTAPPLSNEYIQVSRDCIWSTKESKLKRLRNDVEGDIE